MSRNRPPLFADNPEAGSYLGVKRICQRLRCSERSLFRLYRDHSFPMIQWPKNYMKFGVRGTWWTSEPLIQKWLLSIWEVQRKAKLRGDPWWGKLKRGHGLTVPPQRSGEATQKSRDTRE